MSADRDRIEEIPALGLRYSPQTGTLWIKWAAGPIAYTKETEYGLVDYDADDRSVGVEIFAATEALPALFTEPRDYDGKLHAQQAALAKLQRKYGTVKGDLGKTQAALDAAEREDERLAEALREKARDAATSAACCLDECDFDLAEYYHGKAEAFRTAAALAVAPAAEGFRLDSGGQVSPFPYDRRTDVGSGREVAHISVPLVEEWPRCGGPPTPVPQPSDPNTPRNPASPDTSCGRCADCAPPAEDAP